MAYTDPIDSVTGAQRVILSDHSNIHSGNGGQTGLDTELVLKPSTTYLFRVQNLAGAAKALSLWLFWYEEGLSGAE